ncbi:MAG TPA: hypothetical protein VHW25_01215 [Steroidobacteraceae bacterium]|nr:hypothetical protein [Steroidobacteraceae bacterium]
MEYIESYEELEILLLLRLEATEVWSETRISDRLGLSAALTADAISTLIARGLVKRQGERPRCVFAPCPEALDEAVTALARSYTSQRLEIVKLMHSNAIKRMRTEALRAFSDAFVLRKDDD